MSDLRLSDLLAARGAAASSLWGRTINPRFSRVLKKIGFDRAWARAEGAYLWDADGEKYLDMLGGFGMFNVGRNNPRVRAALIEALELDLPGSVQLGASPLPPLLAEELIRRTPPRLERVLFTSSGTEAVEAALKLGRAATGRARVVSAEHGFHGLTLGSLSANGNPEFTERFGPLLPGFGTRAVRRPRGARARAAAARTSRSSSSSRCRGRACNLPPPGYLEGAQELCRRFGTLFCVDEVQTGFGRTGKLFAFEHWGLEPDLVPVAKSLSGGYVPVGALLMSKAVHEAVFDSLEHRLARVDVRAERARDGGRPGDAARARRAGPRRAERELGERLLELTGRSSSATTSCATCAASGCCGRSSSASRPPAGGRTGSPSASSRASSRSSSSCRCSRSTGSSARSPATTSRCSRASRR